MAIFAASLVVSNFCNGMLNPRKQKTTTCSKCLDCRFVKICRDRAKNARCPEFRKGCSALCTGMQTRVTKCCSSIGSGCSRFWSVLDPRKLLCKRPGGIKNQQRTLPCKRSAERKDQQPARRRVTCMSVSAVLVVATALCIPFVEPETWEDMQYQASLLWENFTLDARDLFYRIKGVEF